MIRSCCSFHAKRDKAREYAPEHVTDPVIAHASKVKRITLPALRRALKLTNHCELCGHASDWTVAFMPSPYQPAVELCAGCRGDANIG